MSVDHSRAEGWIAGGPIRRIDEPHMRRHPAAGAIMPSMRLILGLLGGLALVASSALHGLAGWPAQRTALTGVGASPDLMEAMAMGWLFGSAMMLAGGLVALWAFTRLARRRPTSLVPVAIIGALYAAFGFGVALAYGFGGQLLVFLVPGLMLLAASLGSATEDAGVAR
jgi:hypothetical protein